MTPSSITIASVTPVVLICLRPKGKVQVIQAMVFDHKIITTRPKP